MAALRGAYGFTVIVHTHSHRQVLVGYPIGVTPPDKKEFLVTYKLAGADQTSVSTVVCNLYAEMQTLMVDGHTPSGICPHIVWDRNDHRFNRRTAR
jgi:hypothetical protein